MMHGGIPFVRRCLRTRAIHRDPPPFHQTTPATVSAAKVDISGSAKEILANSFGITLPLLSCTRVGETWIHLDEVLRPYEPRRLKHPTRFMTRPLVCVRSLLLLPWGSGTHSTWRLAKIQGRRQKRRKNLLPPWLLRTFNTEDKILRPPR